MNLPEVYQRLTLTQKWLALYILIVPIMLVPFQYKIQLSEIIFLPLLTGWLICLFKGRVILKKTSLDIPLILYLTIAALSLVNCGYNIKGVIELAGMAYLILLYLLIANVVTQKEQLRFFLYTWMAATSIVVILGLLGEFLVYIMKLPNPFVLHYTNYPYIGQMDRAISTLRNAKMLCAYLVASAGINLSLFSTEESVVLRRWLGLLLIALCILTICTLSRGIFGLLVCIASFTFRFPKFSSLKTLKRCIIMILIMLFIVINIGTSLRFCSGDISFSKEEYQGQIKDVNSFLSPEGKAERLTVDITYLPTYFFMLKKVALRIYSEHPFLGSGIGTFNQKVIELKGNGWLPLWFPLLDPHSTFFGTLAETGTFGFVTLALLFTVFASNLSNASCVTEDNFMRIVLYGFCASFFGLVVLNLNLDIMNFRFLWLLLGLGMAGSNIALNREV